MSGAAQKFQGLKRLAAKAGLATLSAEDQAAIDAEDAAEQAGNEPTDPPAGDPPADPPADPAGDPPPEDPPVDPDPEPKPDANTQSADFKAGHAAASARFAAVLISPAARANLELATDLLATTDLAPKAIVGMCERHKGQGAAQALLDATPKPAIGAVVEEDGAGDRKASVKSAAAKVNRGVGRRAASTGTPVRGSRRPGASTQEK